MASALMQWASLKRDWPALFADSKGSVCLSSIGAAAIDAAVAAGLGEVLVEQALQDTQTALLSSFRAFWLRIGERLRAYQDELDHDGASGSGALSPDATQPSVFLDGNLEWVSPLVREGIPALSAESDRCCARCAAVADRIAAGHPPAALSLQALARRTVQAVVLSTADVPVPWVLRVFFAQRLHEFAAAAGHPARDSDDEEENEDEDGVEKMDALPQLDTSPQWIADVALGLRRLGLWPVAEEAFTAAIASAMRRFLRSVASQNYDTAALPAVRRWLEAVPLEFLRLLLGASTDEASAAAALDEWRCKLDYAMYEALGSLRSEELFDMIIDYPDSSPALGDLKICLANTSLAGAVTASFRAALQKRLLQPGAATADILSQYVSTIRALRDLDPLGDILQGVSPPIKEYLKGRKDTMRCIVTMLTEDTGSGESLLEELARANAHADGEVADVDGADAAEVAGWETWEPGSTADAAKGAALRSADIVSLLVDIYGSKELFVTEYRAMLAERLLAKADYDTDKEVRTLELLKLRFGEAALRTCDVMLKDIADSKRVDANIKADSRGSTNRLERTSATIISAVFWPQLGGADATDFALPPSVDANLKAYWRRYHAIKAPRKLVWKKNLGTVKLKLTIAGVDREFSVSPLHASIIMRFDGRDEWGLEQLATELGTVYRAADAFPRGDGEGDAAVAAAGEDERESAVASVEEQEAAGMRVFQQYVIGMLTNFDSLPLERIHNMLKMFVSDPPYDKSLQQLEAFLGCLVAEEILTVDRNSYSRKK